MPFSLAIGNGATHTAPGSQATFSELDLAAARRASHAPGSTDIACPDPTCPLAISGKVGENRKMKYATLAKNVDSKGRLTLGESFANRTVLVEDHGEGEVLIRLARVIPEREAWLYDNKEALASVRRGLKQATDGKFAKKGPDLKAAFALGEQLQDD
jgi:hypothetical protein